jgi:hypothetical protein
MTLSYNGFLRKVLQFHRHRLIDVIKNLLSGSVSVMKAIRFLPLLYPNRASGIICTIFPISHFCLIPGEAEEVQRTAIRIKTVSPLKEDMHSH